MPPYLISTLLGIVSTVAFCIELQEGVVVTGIPKASDKYGHFVERSKSPGKYWTWMAIHFAIGFGVPALTTAAGI